jgi:hypothetical protein
MGVLPKRLQGQTPSHARSRVQEKETAQRTGGKQTKASGALNEKGDVRVKNVARLENKTTVHDSFSVSVDLVEKLENSVAGSDEMPVMQVELRGGSVKFLVIPDYYLEDILEGFRLAKEQD